MSHQYMLFRLLTSELNESPVFQFIKNLKYTCYRKFIKVYVCQNLSK